MHASRGELMGRYLPRGWSGKRIGILFEQRERGSIDGATLVNDNDGGVEVELVEEQVTRRVFVPWSAVLYVELMEEPDERRAPAQITNRPPGY
jgi:hypothetical protein